MVVNWPVILSISGLIAEIVGVLLMANGYLGVMRWYQVPWILLKCLWRKDTVAGAKAIKNLADEDIAWVLRGLALIGLGFLLQLMGILMSHLFYSGLLGA